MTLSHLRLRGKIVGGFIVLLGSLTLAVIQSRAERVAPGTTPRGLNAADWAAITTQIQQYLYQMVAVDGGYRAQNPAQQWQTRFDSTGFLVTPHNGNWSWGLSLASYGVAGSEKPIHEPAAITSNGNRLEYAWDTTFTEWLVNDTRGLEHGFTIRQRPTGIGNTLQLTLRIQGNLQPQGQSDGLGVTFTTNHGATILQYAGLKVFDAQGNDVPARLTVAANGLRLTIDDWQAVYPLTIDPIAHQAYLKASNTEELDRFGYAVAVSGDTVVVGAYLEDSNATGVNGDQTDNTAGNAGAVYVFVRSGTTWVQQAYLKASNTEANDYFGSAVAVDGDTVVVGAFRECSGATGVNGDQGNNNTTLYSGATYVFVRTGTTWTQQAYLKASNTGEMDRFGWAVAVSGDTVVVGAPMERSNATGVNGNQSNNSALWAGAAYVFLRNGTTWSQQAYLKASNTEADDHFGSTVAVSGDTVVVGAYWEDSSVTGVNGDQSDNAATNSGAAYVFVRGGTTWSQQAYLKASNTEANDMFGSTVAVSGDTVVVGAYMEGSSATGINSDQFNNDAPNAGAVYVFTRNGTTWGQQAYLKASNTDVNDRFGSVVAIDGDTVVVSAPWEDSSTTGVNGDQSDNLADYAGAAYVFVRSSATWSQQTYLKASNTDVDDYFGIAVAVSGDTVVVGADREDSNAMGVNGDQSDNSADGAGAAYVFVITPDPTPTPTPFAISGFVQGFANFSGVNMTGLPGTPRTNSSGYYAGAVYPNWSGVVVPQKNGYYFSPASRSYRPVTQSMTFQNYSAFVIPTPTVTPTPTTTPEPTVTPIPTPTPTPTPTAQPGDSYLLWTK